MALARKEHISFLKKYIEKAYRNETDSFELWLIDHKKMSAAYWVLAALELMDAAASVPRDTLTNWILSCHRDCGGFGGNEFHDAHLLSTLSAVQILAMLDALDAVDRDYVARYIGRLQLDNGSFTGDTVSREVDTRFSYGAALCLSLLGRLHAVDPRTGSPYVRVNAMIDFVLECENFDGGFGLVPGAESHAGQILCCVGTLSLCGALGRLRDGGDALGIWLAERQMESGGFNGRPDKLHDVCYSWWVYASLAMIGRAHWIDESMLETFILACQSKDPRSNQTDVHATELSTSLEWDGGIADRPGDEPDVYHTFFGIAALALMKKHHLLPVDPTYALPSRVVQRTISIVRRYS